MMKTSENGLDLIKRFEGLKLKAYLCPAGVWTIGYGHTKTAKEGMKISKEEAHEFLVSDVADAERAVSKAGKEVDLEQHEFDALVSFVFNVGSGAFAASTLRRLLVAGDKNGAADQFKRWVYSNGVKLNGLVRRREAESMMFKGVL